MLAGKHWFQCEDSTHLPHLTQCCSSFPLPTLPFPSPVSALPLSVLPYHALPCSVFFCPALPCFALLLCSALLTALPCALRRCGLPSQGRYDGGVELPPRPLQRRSGDSTRGPGRAVRGQQRSLTLSHPSLPYPTNQSFAPSLLHWFSTLPFHPPL